MKAPSITSKSARDRLPARREPYFVRLRSGLFLGFRATGQGNGTFIVRRRNEHSGKQEYRSLGELPDYDTAARLAIEWADSSTPVTAASGEIITVQTVCANYVLHLKLHKSAAASKSADCRFKRLVYDRPIASVRLSDFRVTDLKAWLNAQVKGEGDALRRSKDTANRNLASFKAALNLALKDGLIMSDSGWRTVTGFSGVGRRREGFISADERAALMDACTPDLLAFVKALLHTAARPGEIAHALVRDFEPIQGMLKLDGKTGPRTVTLSSAACAFFSGLAAGKMPNDRLLLYVTLGTGKHSAGVSVPWNKETWSAAFRSACERAGLPSQVVMYSLRHSAISEWLSRGMDVFTVAKLAGTSTKMIDSNYGHLIAGRVRDLLDSVSLV